MAINDLPILSALRTKMQWHQERQRVLAENVSNADTPNFRPRDLVEPKFDTGAPDVGGAMGSLSHDAHQRHPYRRRPAAGRVSAMTAARAASRPGRPATRSISKTQMLKVSANQMDYAGGDLALQPQPRPAQDRHRKALTRI